MKAKCRKLAEGGWAVSRRDFVRFATASGLSMVAAGAVPARGQQKKQTLVIADGGGSWGKVLEEVFYRPFERLANVEIKRISYDYKIGTIRAQVESGSTEWTLVQVGFQDALVDQGPNLYEPIDYRVVDAADILPKKLVTKYGAVHCADCNALTYRTDLFGKNPPQSWADMWDLKRFPGRRTAWNHPRNQLEFALIADGVPLDRIYPIDVERALAKWDQIRKDVVWFSSGAQLIQLFVDREVDLGVGWNGRVRSIIAEQRVPLETVYNGHLILAECFVVLKGAPAKDLAMQFINFVLQPEQQALFAKKLPGVAPTNQKAYAQLPPEMHRYLGTSPENLPRGLVRDEVWWAKNIAKVMERWESWRAGG